MIWDVVSVITLIVLGIWFLFWTNSLLKKPFRLGKRDQDR